MVWSKGLVGEAGGHGVVSHAGSAATRLLADRTGLTGALSAALARRGFTPLHDRGRVLADLAVAIADGATAISDIDALRHQGELFGPVASDSTTWRALSGCDAAALARISRARAKTRSHVWDLVAARHGAIPPARAAGRDLGEVIVIRLDATIVIAHSDKQQARGTFKGTWGFHPLTAWCDNTSESLAVLLRPGNAGSNTAADHIAVLDEAIAQIPARGRPRPPPRPGRAHQQAQCPPRLPGPFLGRARLRRADPRRAAETARVGVDPGAGRRRDAEARRAGRRADRAAAPLRRRRPVRDLAARHADPDPPGEPAPRRPAVPVRAARRKEIPGHRHQHPAQPRPVPRSPPQNPGPGRGPDPLRQGNRPAPPAIQELPGQHRVVPGRLHRL